MLSNKLPASHGLDGNARRVRPSRSPLRPINDHEMIFERGVMESPHTGRVHAGASMQPDQNWCLPIPSPHRKRLFDTAQIYSFHCRDATRYERAGTVAESWCAAKSSRIEIDCDCQRGDCGDDKYGATLHGRDLHEQGREFNPISAIKHLKTSDERQQIVGNRRYQKQLAKPAMFCYCSFCSLKLSIAFAKLWRTSCAAGSVVLPSRK